MKTGGDDAFPLFTRVWLGWLNEEHMQCMTWGDDKKEYARVIKPKTKVREKEAKRFCWCGNNMKKKGGEIGWLVQVIKGFMWCTKYYIGKKVWELKWVLGNGMHMLYGHTNERERDLSIR